MGNPADIIGKAGNAVLSKYDQHFNGVCENRADPIVDAPWNAVKQKLKWGVVSDESPKFPRRPWWVQVVTGQKYSSKKASK